MGKHVIEDAKRCLQCKNPGCRKGCPVGTPIREAISLLLGSRIAEAGQLLFANNPLSLVCCHVCPQENQCEGHCVLGAKGSPVQISEIEKYISSYFLQIYKPVPSAKTQGKIAIIGSGPAGITIAFLLSARHYDVTIFESRDAIGGVLRYGIPEFRLPKTILDRLTCTLLASGVRIRPNVTIGRNLQVDDLFCDGYQAVFMGTGVWQPTRLHIKGESFAHVHYAIDYLKNPDVFQLGQRLAVIGAGNTAMDVARTAFRHGCEEVTVICNAGEDAVTARQVEIDYARIDGAKLLFHKTAVEFVEEGVLLRDSQDAASPPTLFAADAVIIAIGQGPRSTIVAATQGIDVSARGLVAVDDCGRTTKPGIFASGDVVTGAKTVVEAVKVSRRVADAMDRYVQGLDAEWGEPTRATLF